MNSRYVELPGDEFSTTAVRFKERGEALKIGSSGGTPQIFFTCGKWWLSRPCGERSTWLDPLFREAGWNVGKLCELLALGKRTFARAVQRSLGRTAKVWLRENRIVVACHLLREEEKIGFTAKQLGFRHEADFTREFRKLIGVTPSAFRERERSNSRISDRPSSGELSPARHQCFLWIFGVTFSLGNCVARSSDFTQCFPIGTA